MVVEGPEEDDPAAHATAARGKVVLADDDDREDDKGADMTPHAAEDEIGDIADKDISSKVRDLIRSAASLLNSPSSMA